LTRVTPRGRNGNNVGYELAGTMAPCRKRRRNIVVVVVVVVAS
jgi:hypothetical protein